MTSIQPQSIPQTTPTIQTKSALLLIQKLKQLRQQYTLYGYSQQQFQRYFINNVLEQDLDNIKDTSYYLGIKIKEIDSKQKMEKILGKVDLELGGIFCQEMMMEELGSKNQNQGKIKEIAAKRKMSKDYRQSKKDKKTKAQRHKKQKKIDQTQLTQQNQDDSISLLKDRTKDLINILISQKSSNLLQKPQNPFNNIFKPSNPPYNVFSSSRNQQSDQQNQNQRIFQKLIEIQMLSKLLCAGERQNESGESFMMRCL